MNGRLTTHVLDISRGHPASGMRVDLVDATGALIKSSITNADGRTDEPLLAHPAMRAGIFEIRFFVGLYFANDRAFLDVVPVRFRISEPERNYHVPLLCSPWAYSTYRGS